MSAKHVTDQKGRLDRLGQFFFQKITGAIFFCYLTFFFYCLTFFFFCYLTFFLYVIFSVRVLIIIHNWYGTLLYQIYRCIFSSEKYWFFADSWSKIPNITEFYKNVNSDILDFGPPIYPHFFAAINPFFDRNTSTPHFFSITTSSFSTKLNWHSYLEKMSGAFKDKIW